MNCVKSTANSFGMIVNSFYELEPVFFDYCNIKCLPKPYCVGPLCLAEPITSSSSSSSTDHRPPPWIRWLDKKLEQGSSVLYVAFGSQAEISHQQFREIAIGLEESKVNFLWVTKSKSEWDDDDDDDDGFEEFEERVKERGMIVRDWVNQREILMHKSVKGFLSHCGWNSVTESVCAGVPILAWPMMAEQHLNARMVAEEIKVGLRVETCDRSVRGFVKREGLAKTVRELIEGEKGKEARRKVREFAEMAKKSHVEEEGSSWHSLNSLIDEVCADRDI